MGSTRRTSATPLGIDDSRPRPGSPGPAGYRTYGKLDVELARDEAPAASLEVSTSGQFFSARIGYEINQPGYDTVDLAALCLRR
jgi:hypothetical protein